MSSTAAWKTWEGTVVGEKYTLRQWLGESEGSAVFVAERPDKPGHKLTLKLISAHSATAGHQLKLWRAAEQLSHPNLIRIYESGLCGNTLQYLAMEYAEENLSEILSQRALTPAEVGELLPPLLDALSYLHSNGLVHGRIKPSNLLAVGDQLKLSADQVAPSSEIDSSLRRRDVYDAPERAAGIVSPAGDLWSLGVTLVVALTRETSTIEEPQGPTLPESIPEPFRSIARQCLQLDPKRRGSVAEIKNRLQPVEIHTVPPPAAEPAATSRSRRGPVAAAVFVLAALVAAVVFFVSRNGHSPVPTPVPASTTATSQQPVAQSEPKPTPAPAEPAPPAKPSRKPSSSGAIVHQILPDVPASARRTISGTIKVAVRVEVDPSGKVNAAKLTNPGPSRYFARLALQAAQRWEFAPGADPSAWQLQFRFRRTSTQAVPQRITR